MSPTEPRDPEGVVRRLIDEGFTSGRLEVCDEVVAPAMAEHQQFGPGHPDGPEGVRRVIASLRRAFPDLRMEIADLAVAGDTVWTRNVATGTHEGVFMGHPPTGRAIRADVVDVMRVEDGLIVEHWGVPDRLGVLFQIGAVSPPGGSPAPAG